MSPWKWASALIAAAALVGPLPAPAAQPAAEPMRASAVLGRAVRAADGEHVGELRDIIFDARTGAIRFVTIELGGAFGFGGREAAFSPTELIRRGEYVVLKASRAALENVPAFGQPDYPAMRASKLIHREVRDRLHQDAGEIVDLLVDRGWKRVRTALVDLRDDLRPGEWIVPVAIEDFSLTRDMGRYAVLNIERSQLLAGAPSTWFQMPASALLGRPLVTPEGERIGTVRDLVLDMPNSRVHSAVLVLDSAGFGTDLYAVPAGALSPQEGTGRVILDNPAALLRNPPGARAQPRRQTQPGVGPPPLARFVRASELLGRRTSDRTGTHAGEIENVVVDLDEGLVLYVVFDYDEAWGLDQRAIKLAPQAFSFPLDGSAAVVNLPRQRLADPDPSQPSAAGASR